MKRPIGPLFVILFSVFGAGLLFQKSEPLVVKTMVIPLFSDRAILNLAPEWEAGLLDGSLKIRLPHPGATVLILMDAKNPQRVAEKLNGDVEGRPFMISGPKSEFAEKINLPHSIHNTMANRELKVHGVVEMKAHGNVYALAIRKEGSLKATAKPKFIPMPPKIYESVKIEDFFDEK